MLGIWVSLKENINCKNRFSDVISQPVKLAKQINHQHGKEAQQTFVVDIASDEQNVPLSTFKELGVGDPSRNVVEKILGAALMKSTKKILTIERVFQVKNSHQVVEKFEKYRDMVKQRAKDREPKHPRSLVDGNELRCFCVTTITCHRRNLKWTSGPCDDFKCNVCNTIGFSFEVDYVNMFGIELSISSDALCERIATVLKGKNEKRAVIICRIIAGRTRTMEDNTSKDEYDSIRKRGFYPNSEYLIVNNPNAVLPCFVVVLN